jgi:hypothetical protein
MTRSMRFSCGVMRTMSLCGRSTRLGPGWLSMGDVEKLCAESARRTRRMPITIGVTFDAVRQVIPKVKHK